MYVEHFIGAQSTFYQLMCRGGEKCIFDLFLFHFRDFRTHKSKRRLYQYAIQTTVKHIKNIYIKMYVNNNKRGKKKKKHVNSKKQLTKMREYKKH